MLKPDGDFVFSISVHSNGNQYPFFGFYKERWENLGNLSTRIEFMYSKNVNIIIQNVKDVVSGRLKKYYLGVEDQLDVEIYKILTKTSEYNKYWPDSKIKENEFPTSDFLFFLEEWFAFLKKYENNQIPNLTYAFHSDGVIIPPYLPDNEIKDETEGNV